MGELRLPSHLGPGGFDHGDVHQPTGRVFIAHTANGTVEVVDGPQLRHVATISDCPEASGVLCSPDGGAVIAAARGAGHILLIDPSSLEVRAKVVVGGRPNGLAWDSRRRRVLVADVAGDSISIVDAQDGQVLTTTGLPGRPRWAVYDHDRDRYLVNVRTPSVVAVIAAETGAVVTQWQVSSEGPHGLDLDLPSNRALVACDGGRVVALDLSTGAEVGSVPIAGGPDAIWFDGASARLFVAIGKPGAIQVVNTLTLSVDETVECALGTQTTALDKLRRRLYLFEPGSGSVLAFSLL